MAAWKKQELRRIAKADDLHIAPFRDDGVTYGTPTWIWSVAVGDELYVRGNNGTRSRSYKVALLKKAGRIIAAGMTKEVAFEPVGGSVNDSIDDADANRHFRGRQGSEMGRPYRGNPAGRCRLVRAQ